MHDPQPYAARILRTQFLPFLAAILVLPELSHPQEEPLPSPSQTVLVVTGEAEAFAGNESVGRIPPGSVLKYSKESGQWLLIPRRKGWLDRKHVVALERAIPFLDQKIKESSEPQLFHHRGIAHAELGNLAAAQSDLEQAIRLGLKDPGVYINRGTIRQRQADVAAAIADYTQALELDPRNARAYDARAGARAELGQLEASLADSNEAVRLDPQFAEAFNNRGVTHRLQGDYAAALADYTQAIEIYAGYAAALANRGYARKQLGEFAAAIEDYEKAIRLEPDAPGAHNDLAWLLATCRDETFRDAARALELASRACELTQHANADYLDTLAAAQAAGGSFDEAAATAEKALALVAEAGKPPISERLALYRAGQAFYEK
jgi:tetratricopeptide (TPR) repeat protein